MATIQLCQCTVDLCRHGFQPTNERGRWRKFSMCGQQYGASWTKGYIVRPDGHIDQFKYFPARLTNDRFLLLLVPCMEQSIFAVSWLKLIHWIPYRKIRMVKARRNDLGLDFTVWSISIMNTRTDKSMALSSPIQGPHILYTWWILTENGVHENGKSRANGSSPVDHTHCMSVRRSGVQFNKQLKNQTRRIVIIECLWSDREILWGGRSLKKLYSRTILRYWREQLLTSNIKKLMSLGVYFCNWIWIILFWMHVGTVI